MTTMPVVYTEAMPEKKIKIEKKDKGHPLSYTVGVALPLGLRTQGEPSAVSGQ
jgi:hypothetical protein